MRLELEESFEHNFKCRHLEELPAVVRRQYYFVGESADNGQDGHLVQVVPSAGESWLGTFAFGTLAPNGKDGLYSWPDPEILCVVSRGRGYLVKVNEPTKHELINVHPVLEVVPIKTRDMVVFANYTELTAYGKSGPVWVSDRLSWDGLKLTKTTDDYIEGETWDLRVEASVKFRVDLSNGKHEGGSYEVSPY